MSKGAKSLVYEIAPGDGIVSRRAPLTDEHGQVIHYSNGWEAYLQSDEALCRRWNSK